MVSLKPGAFLLDFVPYSTPSALPVSIVPYSTPSALPVSITVSMTTPSLLLINRSAHARLSKPLDPDHRAT